MPNGRCRMHGGKTPRAEMLPQYRTGEHSKYRVLNRADRLGVATAEAELLTMSHEIRALDDLLDRAHRRVDVGESDALWLKLRTAWDRFTRQKAVASIDGMQDALADLGRLIEEGSAKASSGREFAELSKRRAQLVQAEMKFRLYREKHLSVEEALDLATLLMKAVKVHVADPAVVGRIADTVQALGENLFRDPV